MNYIQKLQTQNRIYQEQIKEIETEINNFIIYLNTSKFTGVQSDGSRKDWISTGDTIERLKNLRLLSLEKFD